MSQKYDAAAKFFMSLGMKDWLALIGSSTDLEVEELKDADIVKLDEDFEVEELDSDVSTVSASVDKLLRVLGPDARIEHIEAQTFRDVRVPVRLCRYGVLAHYVRRLPVNSTVILLTPAADGTELTGLYVAESADGTPFLQYRYRVIRIWEISAEVLLNSGIGVLALAPLGRIQKEKLPALINQMRVRVERELPLSDQAEFWGGTAILMGLQFEASIIDELLKGLGKMRGSSYAQLLISEGREEGREFGRMEEAKKMLLRVVSRRFGSIDSRFQAAVDAISDLAELERLHEFSIFAPNVDDLLASID